jgi:hypothetical protein
VTSTTTVTDLTVTLPGVDVDEYSKPTDERGIRREIMRGVVEE